MINTGLLLRRPFESNYNAFRRFLIANQTRSYQSLQAEMKRSFDLAPGYQSSMQIMRAQMEERYCREYGIPYVSQHGSEFARRNCPECARLCYHSYLYEYPWFILCPIHGRSLSKHCPDCKHLWPTPSEIPARRCRGCSSHFDNKYLARIGPLESSKGFDVLAVLDEAVRKSLAMPEISLEGWGRVWHESGSQSSADPHDDDWLDFVKPRNARWQRVCEAIGASLFPIYERTFESAALQKNLSRVEADLLREKDSQIDGAIRRKTLERLDRKLRKLCLSKIHPQPTVRLQYGDLKVLTQKEVSERCFKAWRFLVSRGDTNIYRGRKCAFPDASYFERREFRGLPKKPVVMSTLTVHSQVTASDPHQFTTLTQKYAVPPALKVWLYEVDLWRTYLALLGHLHTFNTALRQNLTWKDFYRTLPEDADISGKRRANLWIDVSTPGAARIMLRPRHVFFTRKSLLDSLFFPRQSLVNPDFYLGYAGPVAGTLEAEKEIERREFLRMYEMLSKLRSGG